MINIQLTFIEKGSINERFFYQPKNPTVIILTKLKTFYSYPANQFRKSGIHTEDPLFVKKIGFPMNVQNIFVGILVKEESNFKQIIFR